MGAGIGVLNKSTVPEINIRLSMKATHYYENAVRQNEIFYRDTGAVWYTVTAFARDPDGSNDITSEQVATEITIAAVLGLGGILAAGLTVWTYKTALAQKAFGQTHGAVMAANYHEGRGTYESEEEAVKALKIAFENSKLACEKAGNYAGGQGTWLVVEGGPRMNEEGYFCKGDFFIRKATQEEILLTGVFTKYSHSKIHKKRGKNFQCTKNCPYCKNSDDTNTHYTNSTGSNETDLSVNSSDSGSLENTTSDESAGNTHAESISHAFKEAIKKNELLTYSVAQCIPFGLPHSGKTSLYHRLLDRTPPGIPTTHSSQGSGSTSTDVLTCHKMLQVKLDKFLVAHGADCWEEMNSLVEEIMVYFEALGRPQQQQSIEDPIILCPQQNLPDDSTQASVNKPKIDLYEGDQSPSDSTPSQVDLTFVDTIMKDQTTSDFKEVQTKLDESLTIIYSDCGGQPEFHEVLPALVAGPTIFLLAFSLYEPLDKVYHVCYESSKDKVAKYESICSVKDVLLQCLSSIQSFHEAQLQSQFQASNTAASEYAKFCTAPPINVLIIGTHKDLVSKDQLLKADECLQECIAQTALIEKGIVEYFNSNQLVTPVDNFSGEDGAELRKVFNRIINREDHRYQIELPVSWLGVEFQLRQHNSSVATLKVCMGFALKVGMGEEELKSCLWFLHHKLGTIRYYSEVKELEGTIITQPSVIYKAVTDFITSTFTFENMGRTAENKFHKYGLFKASDVVVIFNRHKGQLQLTLEQFLALLQHRNILGPAHDVNFDWFLPCALAHAPVANSRATEECSILLIVFSNGGFLPKGVFSGLIARVCINDKWEIANDEKRNPLLYRDQAKFIANKGYEVTLRATAKYIEVTADYASKEDKTITKILCTIRKSLNKAVSHVLKTLKYEQTFRFGFYCSALTSCKNAEVKHFAECIKDDPSQAKCSVTRKWFKLEKHQIQWLSAGSSASLAIPNPVESTVNHPYSKAKSASNVHSLILKRYIPQLLKIIADPDRFANDLWAKEMISDHVKDIIITSDSGRYTKAQKLLDDLYTSLQSAPLDLMQVLDILRKQISPGLEPVLSEIESELSKSI